MSHQQNTIQDDNINIADKSFENLAKFTYLEIKLTYRNYILEEVKTKLSSGNCYNYVQTLSSRLLSKTVKIQIYRTTDLLTVLYGSEIRSLTLREDHMLCLRWRQ
jgi:hypothetical protein